MKWLKSNLNLLLSVALMLMTMTIFGPLELYMTNSSEFWFDFAEMLKISGILTAVMGTVLLGIGFLLKGKARSLYAALIFIVALCLYIQGNFLNIDYGILDGKSVDWSSFVGYAVFDTMFWAVFIAAFMLLWKKKEAWFSKIQLFAPVFIIIIQIMTLGVLLISGGVFSPVEEGSRYLSTKNLFNIGEEENIIVFVLDAFDGGYLEEIFDSEPEKYESIFSDFTYYTNVAAGGAATHSGMPILICGEHYPGEITYNEYIKSSFNRDGLYSELKAKGYSVNMYTSREFVPYEAVGFVDNLVTDNYTVGSYAGVTQKYGSLTAYKYMPHLLKRFFWIYTGDFDQYKAGSDNNDPAYTSDDAWFYSTLVADQLTRIPGKTFHVIHTTGSHPPYDLNEFAEPAENVSILEKSKGQLFIVDEYLRQMKNLGVYDSSTIIITSDHGQEIPSRSIMLVKKPHAKDFVKNDAPVSHFDLHNTYFELLGKETGESIFDIEEGADRVRMYYPMSDDAGTFYMSEFQIVGNPRDKECCTETGVVFTPKKKQSAYVFGEILTFGQDGTANQYVEKGVSAIQYGHSWTDGNEIMFRFLLDEAPQNDLVLSLTYYTVYLKIKDQYLGIYVDDTLLFEEVLTNPDTRTITVDVPKEKAADKELVLKLALPDAKSPAEVFGTGNDTRELGLALTGLCIDSEGGIEQSRISLTKIIATPLTVLMQKCYELLDDYILAIIVFTLLSKILLMPVALWMHRSSITMLEMMPELNRIKTKYFGDKETISEETQILYKKRKYNPLASTVPMIVQIVLLMGVMEAVRVLLGDSSNWLLLIPAEAGGITLLMPVAAGFAALVLTLAQNKLAPLQKEQPKAEQLSTGLVSVGISLFLGAFVSLGTGVYWIASNLMSIPVQIVCNWIIKPAKYVNYEELETSKKLLGQLEGIGKKKRESYFSENKRREREDYKRFFSVVNKHLVFYSESNGFYKYYKGFIEFILAHTNMTIHYITSDPNDQIFELAKKEPKIRGYYIGENKLITLMMKMDADVVVMTMPDLENYHIKRSYIRNDIEYINVSHGMGSNNLTFRKGALDHFDAVFCAGIHQKIEIEQQEAVYNLPKKTCVEVGYPLIDDMRKNYANTEHKANVRKKILVAPSWQKDNIIDSCLEDLLDSLKKTDCEIIVRPHPQEVRLKKEYMDSLKKKYEPLGIEIQTDFTSNNPVMEADLLITDWSDISWEYAFTTLRPVMYINTPMKVMNPEWQQIEYPPLNIFLRDQLGKSLDVDQLDKAAETAMYLLENTRIYQEKINELAHTYIYNLGESSAVGGRYIIKAVMRQIKEKGAAKDEK